MLNLLYVFNIYGLFFYFLGEKMQKTKVNVGLIGFGTIGTGVVKLFQNSSDLINRKSGINVELVKICDVDLKKDRGVKVDKRLLTKNVADIIDNPDIDIIIELIGGYHPAYDFVMKAMANKKHIVTANKAMISKYWDKLLSASKKNQVEIMAEASVGGGIPILRAIDKGLAANKIEKIIGILNGTCNYILTKMFLEKNSFEDALKEAQNKGFAEADPYLDISGIDSMHKIIVLSNLSFGTIVRENDVYVEGIDKINSLDIQYADELGYVMKLLAIASYEKDGLNVRVHPVLVSKNNLIASVNYEYNAIYVHGDAVGSTMFYGKGAGQMPTASAVLSDVIYIARNIANGKKYIQNTNKKESIKILPIGKIKSKYYIRFNVVDKAGVLAKISGVLGKNNISIESVIQKSRHSHLKVPVVIMTYEAMEENFIKAINKIDLMKNIVKEKTVFYRVID